MSEVVKTSTEHGGAEAAAVILVGVLVLGGGSISMAPGGCWAVGVRCGRWIRLPRSRSPMPSRFRG